jgi:hypothetical protein
VERDALSYMGLVSFLSRLECFGRQLILARVDILIDDTLKPYLLGKAFSKVP